MMTTIGAELSSARTLFTRGTDLFGAEEIKAVFGLDVTPPPIPFSEEELTLARKRSEMLVYQPVSITMKQIHEMRANLTSDGKLLFYNTDWYQSEAFFTNDALRPGWRLVSREVIQASRSKNYLEQADILTGELAAIYGTEMSAKTRPDIAEFAIPKQTLAKLLDRDWKEAARQLTALAVNAEFRETPAEALWSLTLHDGGNHERLLPSGSWSWTNRLSSGGDVVFVGSFVDDGVDVDRDDPGRRDDRLGFRLSRSGSVK